MINFRMAQQTSATLIKGDHYNVQARCKKKTVLRNRKKVVVFDLDETIGHFHHLQIIVNCLEDAFEKELDQSEFCKLLDLFPEFFRPGIFTVFDFLKTKKQDNLLHKVCIYTNNQVSRDNWVKSIVNYIESRVKSPALFDRIIHAFKIGGRIVEPGRTSNQKIYSDFIRCTMLPEESTEICFIDNTHYEKMCESKVYYIVPRAYFHTLSKSTMIRRALTQYRHPRLQDLLSFHLGENMRALSEDEVAVTKKIMGLVREFFLYPKFPHVSKTAKVRRSYKTSHTTLSSHKKNK